MSFAEGFLIINRFVSGCDVSQSNSALNLPIGVQLVMKVLRLDAVVQVTGLARSTIYKLIGEGEFPRPVPLTGRSVGWIESEVIAWIKSKIEERNMA